jgi:hypothetical protein
MKIKLTKNVNTKASSIKNSELPPSEDSEEKIKKKIFIINYIVIVTHSRHM